MTTTYTVHKSNTASDTPEVSIILLDWSVRERLQALYYLQQQSVPRSSYELIWIELYGRVLDGAMTGADVVITMQQTGTYHKHKGYNAGLLEARGRIMCVCDSDAVFPEDFVASIVTRFGMAEGGDPVPLILMHYQWRTDSLYPDKDPPVSAMADYEWKPLWENVGACLSVRVEDAVRYGGFDEHRNYRGYMCGPYDLGWRLVNAGLPEVWHDPSVALWHFAHPDPMGTMQRYTTLKLWLETTNLHLENHALPAVEHFSTGRMLPRRENPQIFERRMLQRQIGSPLEERYSNLTGMRGFTLIDRMGIAMQVLRTITRVRLIYFSLLPLKAALKKLQNSKRK